MMKICVTGGAGFIGRKLVEKLELSGADIRLLTRGKSNSKLSDKYFVADLAKNDCMLDGFLDGVGVIYNCAGEISNEKLMYSLHVDGTARLLEAVRKQIKISCKPIHWVQLSSVGAYGPPIFVANEKRIVTEDSSCNPTGEYEVTKTLADNLIKRFSDEEPLFTYTILRPSIVVGSEMPNKSLHLMVSMIRKHLFFYIGSKSTVATYIHVDDVVSAMLLCAMSERSKGQVFNLSNDCQLSEIVSAVGNSSMFTAPILCLPEAPLRYIVKILNSLGFNILTQERIDALVRHTWYPYSKIENVLGFRPKCSIPDSVSNMFKKA